jgi:hypothetical protein
MRSELRWVAIFLLDAEARSPHRLVELITDVFCADINQDVSVVYVALSSLIHCPRSLFRAMHYRQLITCS